MDTQERVRAWFLVSVDPERMQAVIQSILNLDDKVEDTRVVVRADIVAGDPYNLIVPMDIYASDDYYSATINAVLAIDGVRELQDLPVIQEGHHPAPPHAAEGFITKAEFKLYPPPEGIKSGRQSHSPGFTPWG